jgi:hypothetical protein
MLGCHVYTTPLGACVVSAVAMCTLHHWVHMLSVLATPTWVHVVSAGYTHLGASGSSASAPEVWCSRMAVAFFHHHMP